MNIHKNIEEYCKVNNIKNIDKFKDECLVQGFAIIKYGLTPKDAKEKEFEIFEEPKPPIFTQSGETSVSVTYDKENIVQTNTEEPKKRKRKITIIKK